MSHDSAQNQRCTFFSDGCEEDRQVPHEIGSAVRRRLEPSPCGLLMARQLNHAFVVDEDRCFGCAACIALCPINVLSLIDRLAVVNEEACTHCELCIPSCPVFALDILPQQVVIA
jgi:electron transport complex protein RnfB